MILARNSKEARDRAEASFGKREKQAQEGDKARNDYEAAARAVSAKTERLKALRLAKEASDREAEARKVPVVPVKRQKPVRSN